jgi:type IV pilus assembly protein PilA
MLMSARLAASRRETDEGFTLIELLVVIIIIGILAAVAIPTLLGQRGRGYDATIRSDLRNAAFAEESYLAGHSSYSAQTPVAGELQGEGFRYSPGGSYQGGTAQIATHLATNGGSFCLSSTSASGNTFVWDSSSGGLLPANTPCSF